ncbi:hypothetical protein D3C85_1032890 [compost metagenome]
MVAQAVADAFEQYRALAVTGPLQCPLHTVIDGEHVVAVHLLAMEAGANRLLRQGRGACLDAPRHRDGPLVVVHHEHHRQLPGTGHVEGLEEVALAGGAVAAGSHHRTVLAADLDRRGDPAGVQGLGGDGHADGEVFPRTRVEEVAAALVAAPVKEDLLHAHAAHQLHGGVAVIGHQHVLGLHQAADGNAYGFLAQGRGVGADAPGALQGHRLLVEEAGQHHASVEVGEQVEIVGPGRQFADQASLGVEDTRMGHFDPVGHGISPYTLWVPVQSPGLVAPGARGPGRWLAAVQPNSRRSARSPATRAGDRLSA